MKSLLPVATLTRGQIVWISHPTAGSCAGQVVHVEVPQHLPAIAGAPDVDQVRSILAEYHVGQLALITHKHEGEDVHFMAFGDGSGRWWDLQGHQLTIRTQED